MISKDNEQLTAYYEGYKPVEHQQNGVVLDTYDDNNYTSEEILLNNTYNDKLLYKVAKRTCFYISHRYGDNSLF